MKLIPTARFVPTTVLLLGLGACGGDSPDDVAPIPEAVDPTANQQLAWVDRSGPVLESIGPRMNSLLDPSISPDGERIAVRGPIDSSTVPDRSTQASC